MDNFDASVIYQLAVDRHHEAIARGEAAQARGATLGAHPLRIRLAAFLVAQARRLGPAPTLVSPARAPAAPTNAP